MFQIFVADFGLNTLLISSCAGKQPNVMVAKKSEWLKCDRFNLEDEVLRY